MKIRTKLIALLMCLAMQPNGLVYAQSDDNFLSDFMTAILIGTSKNQIYRENNVQLCKTAKEQLFCGDGSGGWVDNFIVVFIFENKEAAVAQFRTPAGIPFEAEHCSANSIEFTELKYGDLPSRLQNSWAVPPAGMKAVFHRVRITNGNGKSEIRVNQFCLK